MSTLWARVTGRGKKTLPEDLKKVTHSEIIDIPKELLKPVIDASANEEDRPEIMRHLRECLVEPAGKNWKRVYAAIVLADALMKGGSPDLLTETAEGRHFDLVQQLSFLEKFEHSDKRVVTTIRKKAETLRKEVIPLVQSVGLSDSKDSEDGKDNDKDNASTCSTKDTQSNAPSAPQASGFGSDDLPTTEAVAEKPQGTLILNNIVSVGHNDDTTSESEGGEHISNSVRYQKSRKMTAKERNDRSKKAQASSSDSDEAPRSKPQPPSPPAAPQSMDLLGL